MNNDGLVFYLFGFTFLAVIIYGIVQLIKVSKAKRENKHSALSQRNGNAAAPPATPPRR